MSFYGRRENAFRWTGRRRQGSCMRACEAPHSLIGIKTGALVRPAAMRLEIAQPSALYAFQAGLKHLQAGNIFPIGFPIFRPCFSGLGLAKSPGAESAM